MTSGSSSTAGNPPGTGANGGSSASTGGAGGGACWGCGEYLHLCVEPVIQGNMPDPQCPPDGAPTDFCPDSDALFNDLQMCVCVKCANDCAYACGDEIGTDTDDCLACSVSAAMQECMNELSACINDPTMNH